MIVEKCSVIPIEQLRQLIRDGIDDLPVWLELRGKPDQDGVCACTHEAAVIQDYGNRNDRVVLTSGTYKLSSYNRSWRLWYACGTDTPADKDAPWKDPSVSGK